ncbi:sigma-54-dependent transcriptional regulator [Melioribacteraceae bacterium 4301-Me]|uniref:sigma-54-dependent transcriptional regulator n=1 Tax=Pyranulibacter aquaticus TaxID=3163344 RepID=UPI003594C8F3
MNRNKILIVDDDELVCTSLKKALVKLGYETEVCVDANDALDIIKRFEPDVILLDIYLTKLNGLDLLKEAKKKFNHIPVIMITGYSDVNIAVKAIKYGAYDFLLKPIDLEQLNFVIKKALENLALRLEIDKLQEILASDKITKEYFGPSKKIQKIVNIAEKLAKSPDTTILLEGESGTGKEVFAKFIHQNSPRYNKAFVKINCAAIPRELAESELFGHEKGAFTGAQQKTKLGKFELADGGTILLDEVGELSLDLQVKLLRVLQEKKFYRVGGEKEISVDVRVIAATNKNLEDEVNNGKFREDLYYRLNVAKIQIPPLRERKEDIPFLTYSLLKELGIKLNREVEFVEDEVIDFLKNYYWKGNIRELQNALERAILLMDGNRFRIDHINFLVDKFDKENEVINKDEFLLKIPSNGIKIDTVIKKLILETLKITNGNQVRAAKILGLSRSKLRYRMEQLGIEIKKNIA